MQNLKFNLNASELSYVFLDASSHIYLKVCARPLVCLSVGPSFATLCSDGSARVTLGGILGAAIIFELTKVTKKRETAFHQRFKKVCPLVRAVVRAVHPRQIPRAPKRREAPQGPP